MSELTQFLVELGDGRELLLNFRPASGEVLADVRRDGGIWRPLEFDGGSAVILPNGAGVAG